MQDIVFFIVCGGALWKLALAGLSYASSALVLRRDRRNIAGWLAAVPAFAGVWFCVMYLAGEVAMHDVRTSGERGEVATVSLSIAASTPCWRHDALHWIERR